MKKLFYTTKNKPPKPTTEYSELAVFRWTTLKALLDNKLVASTYIWIFILPIVMSLTADFPLTLPITLPNADAPLVFNLTIPYNWYQMYFAAVCFALARLIYVTLCPDFLKKYNSPSEAISDGLTPLIFKEIIAEYLQRYQGHDVHPLSEEGSSIRQLLIAFDQNGDYVENKYTNPSLDDFSDMIGTAHICESASTGTYISGFSKDNLTDQNAHKSINLPIWHFIELQNLSAKWARAITTILVLAGFYLIASPFWQGLVSVFTRYNTI